MTQDKRPTIDVVICSTRPGRIGDRVATWFHKIAAEDGTVEARLVDIRDFGLPLFDEPRHPKLGEYQHEHTKRWARSVAAADGFAFVAPEYNHGPTPALVNALTYLGPEWALKPAGFVSYGGRSGGLRAAQLTKPILSALKMYPTKNGVVVPMVKTFLDGDRFVGTDELEKEARGLLKELAILATGLAPLRSQRV
ncbi:NADPH-dependent FMN reductase [Tropicimonas aquimaris]|uniref:NADPH-dependent FMN reductase n=1 Tax=Tropicimonas aquimaris TaxID=914152 RepID=A0ABW3IU55_9RHOB